MILVEITMVVVGSLICDGQIISMEISQLVSLLSANCQLLLPFLESQAISEIGIKIVRHQAGRFPDQTADKYPPKPDHRKSEVSPLTNPEERPKQIQGKDQNKFDYFFNNPHTSHC